eukprot:CAMPEP_0116921982 /NCGR_PEP_ID=MMETSP0467-20121206/21971_1 /TAXON_ID=283647 /ORGANISM="Mesodinium pulex, Strain SPMC105" /LENGTH=120 /DNA_ID=CAMNT_0004600187 /DNA_START=109 /DNA_END=471 /DNA_ORIENTATION=+
MDNQITNSEQQKETALESKGDVSPNPVATALVSFTRMMNGAGQHIRVLFTGNDSRTGLEDKDLLLLQNDKNKALSKNGTLNKLDTNPETENGNKNKVGDKSNENSTTKQIGPEENNKEFR